MSPLEQITITPGLTFDALTAGEPGAPLVLLLHGFAESMHCWRAQMAALGGKGYRAMAPSQRGYSPGARPDVGEAANYHIDRLMDDAMAIVAACGYGEARFHLVGHDWGGSIAWALADRYPQRLASLTVLSRPHPNAFNRALQMPDGDQAQPVAASQGVSRTRRGRCRAGRQRQMAARAVGRERRSRCRDRAASCRARQQGRRWRQRSPGIAPAARSARPLGPIRVPTLYIWGDADDTVGRAAAEGTEDFVAAPYRFEVLPGVGHFAADQAPDRVSELLLAHMAAHPV